MNKAALSLWLATATLTPLASAQSRAPVPAPIPAPSAPAAAPGDPNLPNVEDAMLVPVDPPKHVIQSWQEALGLVRSRSVPYRTALAQIDFARARSREALSVALPQLASGLGNTYVSYQILRHEGYTNIGTRETLPEPKTTWGAGLALRVPVFAPKAWYDRGTAEQAIDYAKISAKEAERQVVASVADTIVSAVTAERLSDVSRESLRSALATLDLNRRRSALGASSALDVLRAEGEVQTARAQVVTADELLRRARESLGLALGFSDDWGVNPDVHLDQLGADARATCQQETTVNKRSDVQAAAANLKVVERAKGSVDWAFWPTVDAVSNFQYNRVPYPTELRTSWTIGANLNWLLYDGGLRYGQKDEAEASTRIAREQLNDTQRRAELQVTQAFRAVQVADTNLGVSTKAREIASETARLARVAFINGSGTSFDLVDTASKLRQAEIDLTVKQFEVLRAKVAALLALASCDI